MPKRHPFNRIGDTRRLRKIELVRFAVRNRAVRARARAYVAENHERCRSVMPALADVRTARLFADGMELQLLHDALQAQIVLRSRRTHLEPRRLGLTWTDELERRFDHLCLV
jgi:hypothetical protein